MLYRIAVLYRRSSMELAKEVIKVDAPKTAPSLLPALGVAEVCLLHDSDDPYSLRLQSKR